MSSEEPLIVNATQSEDPVSSDSSKTLAPSEALLQPCPSGIPFKPPSVSMKKPTVFSKSQPPTIIKPSGRYGAQLQANVKTKKRRRKSFTFTKRKKDTRKKKQVAHPRTGTGIRRKSTTGNGTLPQTARFNSPRRDKAQLPSSSVDYDDRRSSGQRYPTRRSLVNMPSPREQSLGSSINERSTDGKARKSKTPSPRDVKYALPNDNSKTYEQRCRRTMRVSDDEEDLENSKTHQQRGGRDMLQSEDEEDLENTKPHQQRGRRATLQSDDEEDLENSETHQQKGRRAMLQSYDEEDSGKSQTNAQISKRALHISDDEEDMGNSQTHEQRDRRVMRISDAEEDSGNSKTNAQTDRSNDEDDSGISQTTKLRGGRTMLLNDEEETLHESRARETVHDGPKAENHARLKHSSSEFDNEEDAEQGMSNDLELDPCIIM